VSRRRSVRVGGLSNSTSPSRECIAGRCAPDVILIGRCALHLDGNPLHQRAANERSTVFVPDFTGSELGFAVTLDNL
jgi:hypothetical protein